MNAAGSSNVPQLNSGVHNRDEMFEVLEDIISNDAKVDQLCSQSSNVQYDDLFTTLNSELYPGVSSFSSLNFLVKLMHMNARIKISQITEISQVRFYRYIDIDIAKKIK